MCAALLYSRLVVKRQEMRNCMNKVKLLGLRVVVFDMDQCLVAQHSRGRMTRTELPFFINAVTAGFKAAVHELSVAGIKVAVATHSDGIEYTSSNDGKPRRTHIIGVDLAKLVLEVAVPNHAEEFFVVAFNQNRRATTPFDVNVHGESASMGAALAKLEQQIGHETLNHLISEHNKRLHMHLIAEHFGVSLEQMVLFDDDERNVRECGGGFLAVQVDSRCGFRVRDLLTTNQKAVQT